MTGNPIGIVICRVGAIVLAVSALSSIGFLITPLLSSSDGLDKFLVMFAIMFLAPIASGVLLWKFAEQISSTPFDSPRFAASGTLGSADLVMIGTYLIGIYVLVFGVVGAFSTEAFALAQSMMFEDNETMVESMSAHIIGRRVSYSVQIVLGIALLIRGKTSSRK